MAAVAFNKIELVKLLLENGADITAKDEDGKTALSVAESKGEQEIMKLLHTHQGNK